MRWIVTLAICLIAGASAHAQPHDWGARRDPFDVVTVRRYKALLARDPHDVGALRDLLGIYKKHRTVAQLEAEYRANLERGEDWATLVVLARLARAEANALWQRAVAAKPDDVRAWLAIGDGAADSAAARDAYRRALALPAPPALQRLAATKLIGAARSAGDAVTVDAGYAKLIELAPKDGVPWLDRGNAQLGAKQPAAALESFARAEALLRTDPERELTAMTNQGLALEALGRIDDAIAQYERALEHIPRGYFLAQEVVHRIVDAERRRKQLPRAIERLEARWPEQRRGHFEWALLGDLYKERGDEVGAIGAYRRAVGSAPTEVVTQRKLIALLDKTSPGEALAQHEAAARLAPGDADLQLELAKRYHPNQPQKAFATLDALARRMSNHVNVRSAMAALYEQWGELVRAIVEYEAIVAAEPDEPDHAVALGDAYWRAGRLSLARAAWQVLDKIGTVDSHFRHGEVLADRDMWNDAIAAYTKALALDATNANAYHGRARAHDALGKFPAAIADARRAVSLVAGASHFEGLRHRQLLVRVLGRWHAAGDRHALTDAIARWRFAFERGDATAGYLLAAHHARIGSEQQHDVLVKLYARVPTDDALGIAVARSFMRRREFGRARDELERIARRTPARATDVGRLLDQLAEERDRVEREIRWEEEGRPSHVHGTRTPDLVGRGRVGVRLGVGGDVNDPSGAVLGLGVYKAYSLAPRTVVAIRLDWMQRDRVMEEVNAFTMSGGITTRLVDARRFELAAGVAPSLEMRYSSDAATSSWERAALAGDIVLELMPRALPATLGMRLHQSFTDDVRSSTLVFELGFEVR